MGNIPALTALFILSIWSIIFLSHAFPSWLPEISLVRNLANSVVTRQSADFALSTALARHLAVILKACLLHGILVLSGMPVLSWLTSSRKRDLLFAWGIGFGLVALSTAGFGMAGLLMPVPVFVFSLAVCAGTVIRREFRSSLIAVPPRAGRTGSLLEFHSLLALTSAVAGATLLLLAIAPDTSWDAVVYHLRLPSFFVIEHKIFHIPTHHFSAFPLNAEMLNSWLMLLGGNAVMGGGESMKVFHLSCAVVAAFAARRLVLELFNADGRQLPRAREAAGWLAVLLVLLCPLTGTISVRAYNDYALAALAGLSLCVLLKGGKGSLVAAGWLCGTACGVKYTAAFFALPMALLWWRLSLAPYLAAGAVLVPWALKNLLLTGNPAAPMFTGLFPSGPETAAQLKAYASSVTSMILDPAVLASAPWTLTRSVEGESVSELLPILLGAYLLFGKTGRNGGRLGWFILGFYMLWGLIAPSVRFFAAVLAPLSAVCALGYSRLESRWGKVSRAGIFALVLLNLIRLPLGHMRLFDPLPYSLGRENSSDYTTRIMYPPPYYGVMARESNAILPRRSRYLLMIDIKSHYFWRRACHDFQYVTPAVYLKWLRLSGSVPGLLKKLRQEGITHILVIPQGARGVGDHFSWKGNELAMTAEFLARHTRTLATAGEMHLLEVAREGAPRRSLEGYEWMLFKHPENLVLAGEYEKALSLMTETKRLAPWLKGSNAYLGMALGHAGKTGEAMPYLDAAVREGGFGSAVSANLAGTLRYRMQDWVGAEKYWLSAAKLKPDFAEAHYNLGVLYIRLGRKAEAIRRIREACRLAPKREEFRKVLESVTTEEE